MRTRAIVGNAICLLVLLPVLPLYGIRETALKIADLMDWLVEDREWTKPLLVLVRKVEGRFQTDLELDQEYDAWRARMRAKRKGMAI